MNPSPRVEGIRLGQRPGGFRHVARVPRMHHRHGETGRGSRGDHGPLVSPGGFADHPRGLHRLAPHHEGGHAGVIGGHGPAFAGRPQGDIKLSCGHIKTHTKRSSRQQHSSPARPCMRRALGLRATVRALGGTDVTTHAPLRSRRT
jgi:hypothetical protein